jgi:cell division protein FtsB
MSGDVLLQYGAIGFIALVAMGAVRVLFQREVKAHQEALDRADRMETELRKLNETIQTQYLTTLAQATLAMSQAIEVIREVNRDRPRTR